MLGHDLDLKAVVDRDVDIKYPGGAELLAFSDAVLGSDVAQLDRARDALANALSPAAVAGASIIAASFTKNDRVANGTGIPAEPRMIEGAEDIREMLGLWNFRSAVNTARHLPEGTR
ncbi:MAG: hypothetical protein CMM26_00690 [Rhodospirillaceae bacterium]|nr:hypothetical protein [Rhodospirillaceae bacterium]